MMNQPRSRATAVTAFWGGALQAQATAEALRWDWGPLDQAPFLPRVTIGRPVLARSQWRLGRSEIQELRSQSGDALFRAARNLRRRHRLPRRVVLADGDHELLKIGPWAPAFAERGVSREAERPLANFYKAAIAEAVTVEIVAGTGTGLLRAGSPHPTRG